MSERIFAALAQALDRQAPVLLTTTLQGPKGNVREDLQRTIASADSIRADEKGVVSPSFIARSEVLTLEEPVLPPERLLLLGGGHVAQPVCDFAARCGFAVTVVDDRPAFANRERFPTARSVICDAFVPAVEALTPGPYDYVVIVTRGHAHDADCLRAVLRGRFPAYLGMVGSRRRVKAQLDLLAQEGFDPSLLERVCTPIGLPIGSVTPEEIAISILAQVISYRRLPQYAAPGRWVNGSDLEPELLRVLAVDRSPKAVATVVSAKGSTPRKAGAKMFITPVGAVSGSIGGGCAESTVIHRARRLIGTGRYELLQVDMTGEVAEDEGMVCGGVMEVLIEDDV